MANVSRQSFWFLAGLALLLVIRWIASALSNPLWLLGAAVAAVAAWRFRPSAGDDRATDDGYVSLRDAGVPLPVKAAGADHDAASGAASATPGRTARPGALPLPPAWMTPHAVHSTAASQRSQAGPRAPERTMGTGAFVFWLASPLVGLATSFLLATMGLGEAAAAALFAAAGGGLIAVGAILNRPMGSRAGRTVLALVYMGAGAFVLFFGGWGAMMVARGGG
jgi:hypothetical protein